MPIWISLVLPLQHCLDCHYDLLELVAKVLEEHNHLLVLLFHQQELCLYLLLLHQLVWNMADEDLEHLYLKFLHRVQTVILLFICKPNCIFLIIENDRLRPWKLSGMVNQVRSQNLLDLARQELHIYLGLSSCSKCLGWQNTTNQ